MSLLNQQTWRYDQSPDLLRSSRGSVHARKHSACSTSKSRTVALESLDEHPIENFDTSTYPPAGQLFRLGAGYMGLLALCVARHCPRLPSSSGASLEAPESPTSFRTSISQSTCPLGRLVPEGMWASAWCPLGCQHALLPICQKQSRSPRSIHLLDGPIFSFFFSFFLVGFT